MKWRGPPAFFPVDRARRPLLHDAALFHPVPRARASLCGTRSRPKRGRRVRLDSGTLNSILQNLVSNAIKLTSKGRVTVTAFLSENLSAENVRAEASSQATRILVVEDNQDTRRLIEIILSGVSEVCATGTVQEAFEQARGTAFDLAFIDINLGTPEGGLEVLRQLRAWPAYESVPLVAMTAYAMPGDRERFLNEGFDAYLSKPFTSSELLDMTAAQLSG